MDNITFNPDSFSTIEQSIDADEYDLGLPYM